MDNDTNLNAVFRHAWSSKYVTKVMAQVKIDWKKVEIIINFFFV